MSFFRFYTISALSSATDGGVEDNDDGLADRRFDNYYSGDGCDDADFVGTAMICSCSASEWAANSLFLGCQHILQLLLSYYFPILAVLLMTMVRAIVKSDDKDADENCLEMVSRRKNASASPPSASSGL